MVAALDERQMCLLSLGEVTVHLISDNSKPFPGLISSDSVRLRQKGFILLKHKNLSSSQS